MVIVNGPLELLIETRTYRHAVFPAHRLDALLPLLMVINGDGPTGAIGGATGVPEAAPEAGPAPAAFTARNTIE